MRAFFLLLLLPLSSLAFDNPYILRSPRGLLMGDAFTALNDDEYSLFYNPATMARHRKDLTITPFIFHAGATNILDDMDKFEDLPTQPVPMADLIMDYPVHASAGTAPGLKLFNLGVTFIANESFDLLLRNRSHPMLDLDLRSDRGVIMGIGIPLGSGRINGKSASGSQTSIGLGAKYIERTGLRDTLALSGPTVLDSLGKDKIDELVKTMGQVKGRGWGLDAGIEHVYRNGPSQFAIGLAALDIAGTEFKVDEKNNPGKLKVADSRDQVNLGLAMGQDWKLFNWIISADVRALNEQMDMGKRLRFGAQLGFPVLKLMGGFNSGYYSYGATLDLFLIKVSGGFYDVELGHKYKQTKSKRFIIYVSLFDFSFDA